ncbi:MAG: adenine deaminase [Bacteroidales bacterium]|nr:adenine deaminase [Bacteroidales bacterium]
MKSVSGNIVDVVSGKVFKGIVNFDSGKIISIQESNEVDDQYILPGLVDAHVHIESSMLVPSEFAKMAVVHGTVATVSDPHEIANVLGLKGVEYMIENGKTVPFKFFFGAPSCVPATPFETSGAQFGPKETEQLLLNPEVKYLAEMMNFPGVIYQDEQVMAKLALAKKYNKPVDGHAPGLTGTELEKYANGGITTDHECFTMQEALDKIKYGIKVQMREGSAARNFDTLLPLLNSHPDMVMFCSDDKHPDELVHGHINLLVKRALAKGYDLIKVLRACSLIPVKHYNLEVGLLQENDSADFIVVDDLSSFNILSTYVDGTRVAKENVVLFDSPEAGVVNAFEASPIRIEDVKVEALSNEMRVFKALDGQLITESMIFAPRVENGFAICDTDRDLLKIMVMNRYQASKPMVGFIHNFGLKKGAVASTVAHDSHNIIAIGANDEDLVTAVNLLIEKKGGICVVDDGNIQLLPLPVGGIMATLNGYEVADRYKKLDHLAKELGSQLQAPFMTLSFMALLVIPDLKISDKGLFDGQKFEFSKLFVK